jgi:hypothetical protein
MQIVGPSTSSATVTCAWCGAECSSPERGWRAYHCEIERRVEVVIVCPGCSERWWGEDEALPG